MLSLGCALLAGCSRGHYRHRADTDAYLILAQKTVHTPWEPPDMYNVVPAPGSRFYDPTAVDDPLLPLPAPQLYAYDLPPLPERDSRRYRLPAPDAAHPPSGQLPLPVQWAAYQPPPLNPPARDPARQLLDPARDSAAAREPSVRELPEPGTNEMGSPNDDELTTISVTPLPEADWRDVPTSCLRRMYEFESVRIEFERTFGREPDASERDAAQKLTLEDIVSIAQMNSREYQTQKEILYRTALRLSLQRFDYDLKFSTGGNRTAVDYTHDRNAGETVNTLRIPTSFQADKMLLTGGDLLTRFANSVVLTFNGPQGFAADVGSTLLFDVSQTIFQRDVRFEPLTQAERDVVYAARDFAAFRKDLFTDLTSQYYALIRTYRQIEIDSQNYFTLARAFRQTEEEFRAGPVPRVQLDQVEQNMLRGRSRLLGTCNSLESALDSLKLRMGLPTETLVNIDLTELEQLTLRDKLAVNRDLVLRVRKRLVAERQREQPDRIVLMSESGGLIERILDTFSTLEQLQMEVPDDQLLRELHGRLQVDLARGQTESVRRELAEELNSDTPSLPIVLQRRLDLIEMQLELMDRQLELAELRGLAASTIDDLRTRVELLRERRNAIIERVTAEISASTTLRPAQPGEPNAPPADRQFLLERLEILVRDAAVAQDTGDVLVRELDQFLQLNSAQMTLDQLFQETLATTDQLLQSSDEILGRIGGGLVPVEIEMDDAMLTALVLRFDLMNERGFLADDWRQIKLAADDLKSVLNLQATQTIETRRDVNRVFDFTFDESQTRLAATLDLPLNRRAQRNTFRQTLIDYQAALRRLMALEDNLKLGVRNDLRALSLDKQQYQIDIASAALAYERVTSTRLEFRLGVGNVAARDFLEAQNDYASALSNVASRHISYIVDRMGLFRDLELLTVDEDGFWSDLYNEDQQPEPYYQLAPHFGPTYGELPPGLKYSRLMRRMEHVPDGTSMIHGPAENAETLPPGELSAPAELPTPPEPNP